jgi:UDP-N-acetylmuramoylalanine--D-glutamate ligase
LLERGARVTGCDRSTGLAPELSDLVARGLRLELGEHRIETCTGADLVVVSPGVPWELPALVAARAAGVPVLAEVELAYRLLQGRVAAVTGTKGKSTTTAALGAMLREAGLDVRVGGNIGAPVCGLLAGATQATVYALELSSFQLEGIERFRPTVAVFLNLSPDHLDRHPSFQAYAAAKARVFENQTAQDWAVVGGDDPAVVELARAGRARLVRFGADLGGDAAFFADGQARLRLGEHGETLFDRACVRLRGEHLAADLLAAGAAARLLGAAPEAIARAVRGFRGIPNVLEPVAELRGVAFYNDTKATNVDASRRSIEAFDGPLLVILGGRYKGGDFGLLREPLAQRGKLVLAIGESGERIERELSAVLPVVRCQSLGEAVARGYAAAQPGDTVLLAPACSSFDMFRDYQARGQAFREAVASLGSTR